MKQLRHGRDWLAGHDALAPEPASFPGRTGLSAAGVTGEASNDRLPRIPLQYLFISAWPSF